MEYFVIDPKILSYIYYKNTPYSKQLRKEIYSFINTNSDFFPNDWFELYNVLTNPKTDIHEVTTKDKFRKITNSLEHSIIVKNKLRPSNDESIKEYIKEYDLVSELKKNDGTPVKLNKLNFENFLNDEGLKIIKEKNPELLKEETKRNLTKDEDHKKELETMKKEENERVNKHVAKIKNDKEEEIEDLKKQLENSKKIVFQLNQRDYIKRKINEGVENIPKQDLEKKVLLQIENNDKEVIDAGINKSNYKKVINEIYTQSLINDTKNEKVYRRLLRSNSSKTPEGIQNKLNKLIEKDFQDDYKRRHYIVPKKKVEWTKQKQSNHINPMILKEIQRK